MRLVAACELRVHAWLADDDGGAAGRAAPARAGRRMLSESRRAEEEEDAAAAATFVLACPGALGPAVARDAGRGFAEISLTWPAGAAGCGAVDACAVFAEQAGRPGALATCWISALERQNSPRSFAGAALCRRTPTPLAALRPLALGCAALFVLVAGCAARLAAGRRGFKKSAAGRGRDPARRTRTPPRLDGDDGGDDGAVHDALFDEAYWA